MSFPDINSIKKSCVFVLEMSSHIKVMEELMRFFSQRQVVLNALQMQVISQLEAISIIHVSIEKDRIRHTVNLMKRIPGVLKIEWLESKGVESFL